MLVTSSAFKPLQLVGTFLLRFVFTVYVDSIFFLMKRIDFMIHKVGDVFLVELDCDDGAVFFLEANRVFSMFKVVMVPVMRWS